MIILSDVLAELPTPCLVVDTAVAERNIRRAVELCRGREVALGILIELDVGHRGSPAGRPASWLRRMR